MKTRTVTTGAVLLVIGIIVLSIGIQELQTLTSPAGQILLFFGSRARLQAERDAAWMRVNALLFGGGILSVIGFVAVIVGAASKEESKTPTSP